MMIPRPRGAIRDDSWPTYMPIVCVALVAVGLAAAVHQRHMQTDGIQTSFWYTVPGATVAAGVIILPFLVDAVGLLSRRHKVAMPLWLFALPVGIGIGFLSFHPVDNDFSAFVFVFTAAEIAARARERRIVGLTGLVVGCATMVAAEVFGPYEGSFIWVIGITFGWVGGFMVGELDARKVALENAQAGLAEKAAADERSRIAREVHDVIAHSLSVTMLHVSAARMALERQRTDDALEALREAEKQGRSSLSEVRRTVGLLGPDESATTAPMPGVLDLPKLVADFRSAGLDVSLRVDAPQPNGVPPTTGLNLYRIVQESLTNVVKHSPGASALVELTVDEDTINLRVHNERVNGAPRNGNGSGMGLRSMRERAALLGGRFETDESDGWTVSVSAPRVLA